MSARRAAENDAGWDRRSDPSVRAMIDAEKEVLRSADYDATPGRCVCPEADAELADVRYFVGTVEWSVCALCGVNRRVIPPAKTDGATA